MEMEGSKGELPATLAALALQFAIAAFGDTIHDAWHAACGVGGPAPAPKLSDSGKQRN